MTTSPDADFYLAQIADLRRPHGEFMALIQRMASGTYQPGSALNTKVAKPVTNPQQAQLANALGRQKKWWIQSLLRQGLSVRSVAITTGLSEDQVETYRVVARQNRVHPKRVFVVRNS